LGFGILYMGSSISRGLKVLFKTLLLRIFPLINIEKKLMKYKKISKKNACLGKKMLRKKDATRILGTHGMKESSIISSILSFSSSKVLVAITPGTLQPKLITRGIKDFP